MKQISKPAGREKPLSKTKIEWPAKRRKAFLGFLVNVAKVPRHEAQLFPNWILPAAKLGIHRTKNRESGIRRWWEYVVSRYDDFKASQGIDALKLYWFWLDRSEANPTGVKKSRENDTADSLPNDDYSYDKGSPTTRRKAIKAWHALDTSFVEAIRLRGRSYSTEQTYRGWLRRFGEFLDFPPRDQITADKLRRFLTSLAVENSIAVATQQQAFNALLFFYRYVLHLNIDGLASTVRSRREGRSR